MELDVNLIDWSRAQFAMTAIYHWLFVPLTLGLSVIMAIMETVYYKTGNEFWKRTAKFWMKIFGINFAIGVATGIILEFEFGTNWSNYSWFVGDIFGAPLAIEGILAFFMEATFVAVMFFGWNKVGKKFHLASTWLTGIGAAISAWWILVANSWMQYPVGMEFNPETVRNEMTDFFSVAFSPVAVTKFFHAVISSWIVGSVFVIAVASWYLLRKGEGHRKFALSSIKVAGTVGLAASLVTLFTGDKSAYHVAQYQPMKLAAIEGLYEGGESVGLVGVGVLNPDKTWYDDGEEDFLFDFKIPYGLSLLATRDANGFVPGVKELIEGGYTLPDGGMALSAEEKMVRGRVAVEAMAGYREVSRALKTADADSSDTAALEARLQEYDTILDNNMPYFGYGYIDDPKELLPNVPLNFYAFRIMVVLGSYFILFFIVLAFLAFKDRYRQKWLQWVAVISLPLAYICSQAGWIVAEAGRQPWAIQDLMPVNVAVSNLSASSVQVTFFLFLALFTILLIAEIGIMVKAIKKGPELEQNK